MKKKTITTALLTATIFLFPAPKVEYANNEPISVLKGYEINSTIQNTYEETVSFRDVLIAELDLQVDKEETQVVEEVVIVKTYYTTTHPLNIRQTPNIDHTPIGWFGKGQPVLGLETLDNGWVKLSDGGYVNGKYLARQEWTHDEYLAQVDQYDKMVKEQAAKAKAEREARAKAAQAAAQKTQITGNVSSSNKPSYTTRQGINITSSDRDLIARLVRAEAGGESYEGMVAVANVVLNRVASSKFPNTVQGVIYAKNQFVPAATGSINKAALEIHFKAVDDALTRDNTNGALFFYNPKTAKSRWLDGLQTVAVIGNHTFKVN